MKKKILSLVFTAALLFGFAMSSAESSSDRACEGVTLICEGGGGTTGIVCEPYHIIVYAIHFCGAGAWDVIYHELN
jgi:hypothetical protein